MLTFVGHHEWDEPIVTITIDGTTGYFNWTFPSTRKYTGFMNNILDIPVQFKYRKPQRAQAEFRVVISVESPEHVWTEIHRDQPIFSISSATDESWHTKERKYPLRKNLRGKEKGELHFKVEAGFEQFQYGDDPLAPDFFVTDLRGFLAYFSAPPVVLVKDYVNYAVTQLQAAMNTYEKGLLDKLVLKTTSKKKTKTKAKKKK